MQYKEFKDIRLSRLGMGNMRLPEKGLGKKIDRENNKIWKECRR